DTHRNLEKAGMSNYVNTSSTDFFKLLPGSESGKVILNPPYGERLPVETVNAFYKQMGDHLKRNWAGHTVWMISSNLDALKHFGLKPSSKLKWLNGSLPCLYQQFDLFRGNRREQFGTA
ncbi:MAG: class I SAM-dependent RNA methyltransferase, partial [Flavobacteriales bacterium]|nr:class I SAM-dependent RNA methyltransferase [Flavobacteriales bacterium]